MSPERRGEADGLPRPTLRVLAVVAFSLASTIHRVELSAVAAVFGLVLIAWSWSGDRPDHDPNILRWAGLGAIGVIAMSWISRVGPPPPNEGTVLPFYQGALIVGIVLALIGARKPSFRQVSIGLSLGAVVLLTAWVLVTDWRSEFGTDVYLNHEAAGEALFSGEDPYGDAVRIPDGNPYTPEDAIIVGYSYPPPVLLTYAVMAELGDSRIISAVAWLILLSVLAARSSKRDRLGEVSFAIFLVLAATPVWPVMVFVVWTEPLTLLLLFAAFALWRKSWLSSAIFLGLALASKQYFVLLLPFLLLMRVDERNKRLLVAGGTAILVLVPPLIVDAGAYLQATVINLLEIGFRPDSASLPGLLAAVGNEFMIPRPMWIAMIAGLGIILAARTQTRADVALSFAVVLGFGFWTGIALPNYWFLVMGLAGLGAFFAQLDLKASSDEREKIKTNGEVR